MAIAYQYDASGYFAGGIEDYNGLLPNNSTHTAPEEQAGYIQRWNGCRWEQVENHKGREGYLNGQPHTIADFGPLPEGFSDTPPALTIAQAAERKCAEIMSAYNAEFASSEALYPAAERAGWPVQEAEAKSILEDPQAEAPVLSGLAQFRGRGETVADLAAKVLKNAGEWRTQYARLTGQQQRMHSEVSALAERARKQAAEQAQNPVTAADILAYPVTFTLSETAPDRTPAPVSEDSENTFCREETPDTRQYPRYGNRKAPIRLPLMRSHVRGSRRV